MGVPSLKATLMHSHTDITKSPPPWNNAGLVGQKASLRRNGMWAIRMRLQLADKARDLVLCNLAIDSKRRGCDLLRLRVCDIAQAKKQSSGRHGHAAQDAPSGAV